MLVDPKNEFAVTHDAMLRNVWGNFNGPTTGIPDVEYDSYVTLVC